MSTTQKRHGSPYGVGPRSVVDIIGSMDLERLFHSLFCAAAPAKTTHVCLE
eukprot:m.44218 g.44218  ORF g.44218 m.44218 type:complete len:51 (-) comp15083_c0_seq1:636-788(-)